MEKQCIYKHSDVWHYVQNRMSREEETEFQRHLCTCSACREELTRLRAMVHSVEKKEHRLMPRVWMIVATVACLVVGGGLYRLWNAGGQDGLTPVAPTKLPVHPPVMRQDVDSIEKSDTLLVDTCYFPSL